MSAPNSPNEGPDESQALDSAGDLDPISKRLLESEVIEALQTVYDPEIPVDVYNLGLIYGVDVRADATVHITMTLTSPMCPVAEALPLEVEQKVRMVPGVRDASVELVWDPPFGLDRIPDHVKLQLGLL